VEYSAVRLWRVPRDHKPSPVRCSASVRVGDFLLCRTE
jgi:hypothetical protein